jgi:hypothetical protein
MSGCSSASLAVVAVVIVAPVSGSAAVRGAGCWFAVCAVQGALQPPLAAAQAQPIIANTMLVRFNDMR